jgi:ATP-dependent protease ClpP protease subunit
MNTIKKIYREHTKIPSKKLEEILKKDIYLSSEEALKFGLVDCII